MNQLSLPLVVIGIAISSPLPAAMVFNPDEDIMTSSFFFPPNSVRGHAGEGRDVFRVSNNNAFGLTGAETIYLSFQSADLSSYANPIEKAILTMTSWQAIKEWIPDDDPDLNWFNQERDPTGAEGEHDPFDQSPTWQPVEVRLGDGRILVLDDS
ncbi:hypothetical protein OAF53_01450 [Akkermansiaceae bacterium]|nr:hypothetical protein [Akkermansiaceae bacterium]MDB4735342.1 hypothetical protein [Akkermansiaceae bacterium]